MKLLIVTQKVNANDQLLGFFIDWLKLFSQKFEKITVLCLEKGNFDLPKNIKVISLGKDQGVNKFKQLFNFYSYIFNLSGDYDSVFVHMNPIWVILGGPMWRFMDRKIFFWYTHKAVTPKLKFAEKLSDVIFTASKESFRLPSKKVIITGHGIDTELFKPVGRVLPNGILRLLSVGRIAPVKNYGILIEAAKILREKNVDFAIDVVGEPALNQDHDYMKFLKAKIKSLNLENHFNFIGKVGHKDLAKYYQAEDVFIHLSKTGSVDKTLLEAMACGMKVLSSNDSARAFLPKELLFNESSPSELAEKIRFIKDRLPDQSLREYVIKNHNLDVLIEKISQIIKQ